jgi:hypothetical protein
MRIRCNTCGAERPETAGPCKCRIDERNIMADNLGVNPKKAFSSDDEGVDYPILARRLVVEHYNNMVWIENPDPLLKFEETYVVTFSYIVGNWKALVSTSRPDGRVYEVTSNKEKSEIYVDEYQKQDQTIWPL